jgi:AcrR family transcriptional regulator
MPHKQTKDRRIQKTLKLLHEALGSLIREKPYDDIVVQEILDRANVGRSTFYMHFRDKDELLVSSIHDLLESVHTSRDAAPSVKPDERILSFSLPVFEHIHQHLPRSRTMMGAHGRAVVHGHLQKVLAERIAHGMSKHFHGRRRLTTKVPQDVLVQYIASTFILVLNWWAESRKPLPPVEADALFRALVMPTLEAA